MKFIPKTKLICIDGSPNNKAKVAIAHCLSSCKFEEGYKFINNPNINSVQKYNDFILKELYLYTEKATHVLIIQEDGFILNPDAWRDEWLEYDYIGAPWNLDPAHKLAGFPNVTSENCVGNGGFSLRSTYLINTIKDILSKETDLITFPEDALICRKLRQSLIKDYRIRFATQEVASEFSVENSIWCGQFGFHGKVTMNINGIII